MPKNLSAPKPEETFPLFDTPEPFKAIAKRLGNRQIRFVCVVDESMKACWIRPGERCGVGAFQDVAHRDTVDDQGEGEVALLIEHPSTGQSAGRSTAGAPFFGLRR